MMLLLLVACHTSRPPVPEPDFPAFGRPMRPLDASCEATGTFEVTLSPNADGPPILAARQGPALVEAWVTDALPLVDRWVAKEPYLAHFRAGLAALADAGKAITAAGDHDLTTGSTTELFQELLKTGKVRVTWEGGQANALVRTEYWCPADGTIGHRWCVRGGPCFEEEFFLRLILG